MRNVNKVGAAVVATLLLPFPVTLIAYGVAALLGQPKRETGYRPSNLVTRPGSARAEMARDRMRDLDRRMQEIETYVTSSNSSLAREIEELRKD